MEDAPDFGSFSPIGHNRPPTAIEHAVSMFKSLDKFLNDNPVIQDQDAAIDAKLVFDRAQMTLTELEKEKEAESKPLHSAWQECLAKFRAPRENLERLFGILRQRMTDYAKAEKRRLEAEAAERARIAAEAEAKMLAALKAETEAKEDAEVGVLDAKIGEAIQNTDAAYVAFRDADAAKTQVEKAAEHVGFKGGFGNAVNLKTVKVPVIKDAAKVFAAVGATDDVKAALMKSARAYKKLRGSWPDGIEEVEESKI